MPAIIDSKDFVDGIRRDPYMFLKNNKGKIYSISGTMANYQPYADFMYLNEKPYRVILIFDRGSISSEYEQDDIPKGALVTVKGKLSFIQWTEQHNLQPSFIGCELLNIE